MTVDFDILDGDAGLPPWDLHIMLDGVKLSVRMPTGQEVCRIIDLKELSREACWLGFVEIFSALTGVDRVRAASFDREVMCAWIDALCNMITARLEAKRAFRQGRRRADPPVVTGPRLN